MMKKAKNKVSQITLQDASMLRRLISYLIDWYVGALVTALPIAVISQKLMGTMLNQDIIHFPHPYGLIGGVLGLLCAFGYYVVIPMKNHSGQTFGKRLCKIKIVQENGQDITWKNMLLRQVLGIIIIEGALVTASAIWHQVAMILTGLDFLTPLKYIGLGLSGLSVLLLLFHKNHRALHDYIGKTKVVMSN